MCDFYYGKRAFDMTRTDNPSKTHQSLLHGRRIALNLLQKFIASKEKLDIS